MAWGLTTPRALGHPARLRWARRCRRTAACPAEPAKAPSSRSAAVACAGLGPPGPLDPVSVERWGLGKVGGCVNEVCGGGAEVSILAC